MTSAAVLALHGQPALRYLLADDRDEQLLMEAVARRAVQLDETRRRNLAVEIVNQYAKARRRG